MGVRKKLNVHRTTVNSRLCVALRRKSASLSNCGKTEQPGDGVDVAGFDRDQGERETGATPCRHRDSPSRSRKEQPKGTKRGVDVISPLTAALEDKPAPAAVRGGEVRDVMSTKVKDRGRISKKKEIEKERDSPASLYACRPETLKNTWYQYHPCSDEGCHLHLITSKGDQETSTKWLEPSRKGQRKRKLFTGDKCCS